MELALSLRLHNVSTTQDGSRQLAVTGENPLTRTKQLTVSELRPQPARCQLFIELRLIDFESRRPRHPSLACGELRMASQASSRHGEGCPPERVARRWPAAEGPLSIPSIRPFQISNTIAAESSTARQELWDA